MDANVQNTKALAKIEINDMEIKKKIYKIFKRIVDILGALFGCIILIPLTIGIFIANVISKDNGPIFYVQKRIGKNGKKFKMIKYRSMVVNADQKLRRYLLDNPKANEEFVKYRKLKEDPRITPIGDFIRKTSLDEFPQFINVLKGDMSLVGPRPYLPREKRAMGKAYKEIIKVKPGLTGPWQVAGRSEISLSERLKMDIEYVENENLKNDTKYFFGTFTKIFSKKGAI